MPLSEVLMSSAAWRDHWRSFSGTPEQLEAIELLRRHILQADPLLLARNAEWVEAFGPLDNTRLACLREWPHAEIEAENRPLTD